MRFADGVWPFEGSRRCPEFDDYYYAQYNPGSTCPTANLKGIGKPAPGGVPPEEVRKPKPRLALSVSPVSGRGESYRFRVSGRLVPPDFITLGRACNGGARLTVTSGTRTLQARNLRVTPNCRIGATVTVRRPQRLEFTVRFLGNASLAGRTRQTVAGSG